MHNSALLLRGLRRFEMDDVRKAFEEMVAVSPNVAENEVRFAIFIAGRASLQSELEAVKLERDSANALIKRYREERDHYRDESHGMAAHQSLEALKRKVRNKVRRECVATLTDPMQAGSFAHRTGKQALIAAKMRIEATIEPEE